MTSAYDATVLGLDSDSILIAAKSVRHVGCDATKEARLLNFEAWDGSTLELHRSEWIGGLQVLGDWLGPC